VTAEVGETFAFLLRHVIAVRQVHTGDCIEPFAAAHDVLSDQGDGVPDVVVIMDRVDRLRLSASNGARGHPHPEQLGVEDLLLGGGMHLQERGQACPDRLEGPVSERSICSRMAKSRRCS
jgi:hypothetical protein